MTSPGHSWISLQLQDEQLCFYQPAHEVALAELGASSANGVEALTALYADLRSWLDMTCLLQGCSLIVVIRRCPGFDLAHAPGQLPQETLTPTEFADQSIPVGCRRNCLIA